MRTLIALCASLVLSLAATAEAADPLSIAAAGVTTSIVLDKAAEKANQVIGNAAAAGSLVASKAARDVNLLIEAARQQLHDELSTNWDKLDSEKISILREIDSALGGLEGLSRGVSRIQDAVVLDVDATISRLPFAKSTPVIRRVEGASQYLKVSGSYRVVFTTNLVPLAHGAITARLDGQPLPAAMVNVAPPYGVAVTMPVERLNPRFNVSQLSYLPLELVATVSTERGYKFWQPSEREVVLPIKLELFPRRAATYSLTEWRSVPAVDRDHPQVQGGGDVTVPGCGNSGCNTYHPHCVGVPAGAQPIDAINFRDSFAGWGGWGGASVQGTQVCATYWQHSHNVARNVGFDARYYPVMNQRAASPARLDKIDVPGAPPPLNDNSLEIGATYSGQFSQEYSSYDFAVRTFTGETIVATPSVAPSGSMIRVSPVESQGAVRRVTVSFQLPW